MATGFNLKLMRDRLDGGFSVWRQKVTVPSIWSDDSNCKGRQHDGHGPHGDEWQPRGSAMSGLESQRRRGRESALRIDIFRLFSFPSSRSSTLRSTSPPSVTSEEDEQNGVRFRAKAG